MIERDIARLERSLELLARAIVYPTTPPIAEQITSRLHDETASPRVAPAWALAGVAMTGLIVLIAALVSTVSPLRDAVADVLDRVNIFEADEPSSSITRDIEGFPVSLNAAEDALGFEILRPAYPKGATIDELLLQEFGEVRVAVLFVEHPVFESFALFQTNATVGKGLSSTAQAEAVEGFHEDAFWLRGLRIVQYQGSDGEVLEESIRATEANTLVWEQDGRVFRLEGNLSLEDAVLIARSLR
ncbi:MAG: hypothetical protein IH957_04495 [Chloroflexi bacterium]|nr:hypothetical protein [Chloroflexota bacterium]